MSHNKRLDSCLIRSSLTVEYKLENLSTQVALSAIFGPYANVADIILAYNLQNIAIAWVSSMRKKIMFWLSITYNQYYISFINLHALMLRYFNFTFLSIDVDIINPMINRNQFGTMQNNTFYVIGQHNKSPLHFLSYPSVLLSFIRKRMCSSGVSDSVIVRRTLKKK